MSIIPFFILTVFSIVGLFIGIFLYFKPHLAIEIQRRFYEKINWKIEPISMPKEIRSTKVMGVFLIIAGLTTIAYILTQIINA